MGQCAIPSWISRHSYHSAEQTVKNKKLDHRVYTKPKGVSPDDITKALAAVAQAGRYLIQQEEVNQPVL